MYRINTLLKEKNVLFHTRDLALIWNITNDNTLYTLIKRYLKKKILFPIQKGYYSTLPLDQIDPILIGVGYLHQYCYVSCEYVLAKAGIIFQHSPYITFVSSYSKKFTIGKNLYWSRKMADRFLYNQSGVIKNGEYYQATVERAVADLLYFNKQFYFDNQKGINWKKVKLIQKEVGYL